MEKIKVILIDPVQKTVELTEIQNTVKALQELMQCDHFDLAGQLISGDDIFVDDDGLFRQNNNLFLSIENGRLLTGRIVIAGRDSEGNTKDVQTTVEYVQRNTRLLKAGPLYTR